MDSAPRGGQSSPKHGIISSLKAIRNDFPTKHILCDAARLSPPVHQDARVKSFFHGGYPSLHLQRQAAATPPFVQLRLAFFPAPDVAINIDHTCDVIIATSQMTLQTFFTRITHAAQPGIRQHEPLGNGEVQIFKRLGNQLKPLA